ncbi:efflux RND transporter periplasmic adaptor subunit [Ramlibacter sp. PS3R-8]|uniref:efflux RND transporter periplasmic adaptor subunit n=1 Tax=Ramlibacter sp. PS3R-8 TaxID=3133437 RepID=UPI0030AB22DA
MNRKQLLIGTLVASALVAGGAGMYWLGTQRAAPPAAGATAAASGAAEGEDATRRHIASGLKAGDTDPVSGRKILYYHDPMVPQNKFDKPAKSPFMDMMLVPVFAGGESDQGMVSISPRVQQNLGIRTAIATEGAVGTKLQAVGTIVFNERNQAVVQSRASAFVQRVHVRATLDGVRAGQVLAELYVPDWIAAQEEFLGLRRMKGNDLGPLIEGAKARMRLAGMNDDQIRRVEASGRPDPRVDITSPITGLVTEIGVRDGMAVGMGTTMFKVNDFATVWANAEIPESQAHLLRRGAPVVAESPMQPGERFNGKVEQLLPSVDPSTRTIKARVELANKNAFLVPGMFVSMEFTEPRQRRSVLIPTEALIYTGQRTVVMVAEAGGRFRPVEVEPGTESGGQSEIRKGLQAGQRVVVSSQFLVDSEASLRGVEARLNNAPAAAGAASPPASAAATAPAQSAAPAGPVHQGTAKIEAVTKEALTLSHGPIPSIKWGAMTMDFQLPPARDKVAADLKAGDQVSFEFVMGKDGLPQLTRVTRAAGAPALGARQ